MDKVGESESLWLDHEPSFEEVKEAFERQDMLQYDEVVFCGFGEPTEAFPMLKQVAKFVKDTYHMPIRVNTNGLGNLIWDRDITPEFEGLVDTISISLNTPNAEKYHEIVRSKFGNKSFDAMLTFAKDVKKYVPNVVLSTVSTTISKEEEEKCAKICEEIGVTYRIRPYEE